MPRVTGGPNLTKGTIFHGSNANTPRPVGFGSVEWRGSVQPLNSAKGDTWADTSTVTVVPLADPVVPLDPPVSLGTVQGQTSAYAELTLLQDCAAGDVIVAFMSAAYGAAYTYVMSDSVGGNTWASAVSQGASDSSSSGSLLYTRLTNAIPAGGTIRATLPSGNLEGGLKVLSALRITGLAAAPLDKTASVQLGSGVNWSIPATAALVQTREIEIYGVSDVYTAGTANTESNGWTDIIDTAYTNHRIAMGYKLIDVATAVTGSMGNNTLVGLAATFKGA